MANSFEASWYCIWLVIAAWRNIFSLNIQIFLRLYIQNVQEFKILNQIF